jgi:hypothetical protein
MLFLLKINIFSEENKAPIILLNGTTWLYIDEDEDEINKIPPFKIQFLQNGAMLEHSPYDNEVFGNSIWVQKEDIIIMYVNDMYLIEVGLILSETLIKGIGKNADGYFSRFRMERISP